MLLWQGFAHLPAFVEQLVLCYHDMASLIKVAQHCKRHWLLLHFGYDVRKILCDGEKNVPQWPNHPIAMTRSPALYLLSIVLSYKGNALVTCPGQLHRTVSPFAEALWCKLVMKMNLFYEIERKKARTVQLCKLTWFCFSFCTEIWVCSLLGCLGVCVKSQVWGIAMLHYT